MGTFLKQRLCSEINAHHTSKSVELKCILLCQEQKKMVFFFWRCTNCQWCGALLLSCTHCSTLMFFEDRLHLVLGIKVQSTLPLHIRWIIQMKWEYNSVLPLSFTVYDTSSVPSSLSLLCLVWVPYSTCSCVLGFFLSVYLTHPHLCLFEPLCVFCHACLFFCGCVCVVICTVNYWERRAQRGSETHQGIWSQGGCPLCMCGPWPNLTFGMLQIQVCSKKCSFNSASNL